MSADTRDRRLDLALLLELSLAIGESLDLAACCERFLRTLMARKNLAYAAVWLDAAVLPDRSGVDPDGFELVYGSPRVHVAARRLPATHPIALRLADGPFSVQGGAPGFAEVVHEARVRGGTYTILPLDGLGYLKLYAIDERRIDRVTISQLETLTRKFAAALRGCLAHAQVVHDAEVRQQIEEGLRQTQKLEAVGQLAGGIAHDFNNIVAAISGFAELLTLPGVPPDRVGAYAQRILGACDRAGALTAPLLAFSRRGPSADEAVALGPLVDEVVGILSRTIDPRIELRVDATDAPIVRGDPAQLHALLLNLALNARDAQPDGGAILFRTRVVPMSAATVAGQRLAAGTYARVEVIDEGHGMTPDVRARAFDPFFTTKPVGKGSGLGLAVAYGTVRSHGGVIDIDSVPSGGTRVSVLLPVTERVPGLRERPAPMGVDHGRVLLVDDEDMVRDAGQQMLVALGLEVTAIADGALAVDVFRCRAHWFDLVIVDLVMPGLDGAAVLRALREIRPDVRVLVASGFGHPDLMARVEALRPHGFLRKPFRLAALAEHVARALRAG